MDVLFNTIAQICSRPPGSEYYIMTLPGSLDQLGGCTTEDGINRLHLEIDNRGK